MTTPQSQSLDLNDAELRLIGRQARLELIRRAAARKDILTWGQLLFPEKFNVPFCRELHGYFVDIRHEPFTSTEAPRGHAKTTIKCFLIPIFQALEEPKAFIHYLNVQATEEKALAINRSIKHEMENNLDLIELYGDQIGDRWTDGQFVTSKGVVFTALGAGQSIRGVNYNNVRPDYVIVDDLYDREDINNYESTKKKNDWFWGDLYPARAKSKASCVHVQGTAINKLDLMEKLKGRGGVRSRTFKTVTDFVNKTVLWAELNTYDQVMWEKEQTGMPTVIWFREYQNERRDDATSLIKRSWLYSDDGSWTWEYDPATLAKFDMSFVLLGVILGVDPSIGEKETDDFTGVALVLKAQYNDASEPLYFIEALWNEHATMNDRVLLLDGINKGRPRERTITSANIEAIAGFKDFASEVERRTGLPVNRIERVKDKITNRENKSGYFERKRVRLNKDIDPVLKEKLVEQLTNNKPPNDDLSDAVFLALDDNSNLWGFVN